LLGPNGAGKSTILSMVTGDLSPSSGTVWIHGTDITKSLDEAYKISGYCPQFDPFPLDLTGRELLELFAKIKGYSAEEAKKRAIEGCKSLGIFQYIDQLTKGYSGGTKRKLSVAISLVAQPRIVYLDEPSTGIDPASKHFLWEVIKNHMGSRTTVLTTHSMEEAQALCSRIGIMVNGQLVCLGTSQHIKSKFGSGMGSKEITCYFCSPRSAWATEVTWISNTISEGSYLA
jgi:ABC-type multidrug transport system ATPase subunit